MASSASPSQEEGAGGGVAAVCCMCGDHGLPHELFRCRACRVRLQHSYCSDLYPRATTYRRCNWCLRDPPPAQAPDGGAAAHAAAAAVANGKLAADSKRKPAPAASDEERQRQRQEGCSSRRPPAELGYPVKKRRNKADEIRAPDDAAGESKELMRAGKAPRVRVKVRRYKLLAEVISC
ncbi:hypothetical protein EJB05_37794, partial [Eragrostis curvula]